MENTKEIIKTEVFQDKELKATFEGGLSPNDAFVWLLRNQGQSTDWAIRYGGWSVKETYNDGTVHFWQPYDRTK